MAPSSWCRRLATCQRLTAFELSGNPRVVVEDEPTPIVAALANDLDACLGTEDFAEATRRLRGVVGASARGTPQSVTVRLDGGRVALAHGLAPDADVLALVPGGEAGPEVEGRDAELVAWTERLLAPPLPAWDEAAARFWATLEPVRGAPAGLVVVNLDLDEALTFGAEAEAYELRGRTDGLVAVLTGRLRPLDGAYGGEVFIHGTFRQLSVLTGAGFEIRYGRGADDG